MPIIKGVYKKKGYKAIIITIIEVSQLDKEIKSGSKSLAEERALEIAYRVGELK